MSFYVKIDQNFAFLRSKFRFFGFTAQNDQFLALKSFNILVLRSKFVKICQNFQVLRF